MFAAIALVMLTPLPDLGRDRPPLSDLRKFPDATTADVRWRGLQHQHCVLHQKPKSPERENAIRQVEYAIECWEALMAAHDQATPERDRREWLEQLNRLLGDKNYRRGRMP